jgi:hypothetical protein
MRKKMAKVLLILATIVEVFVMGHAISNQAAAHDIYTNWVNLEGKGCCNGVDCKAVPEDYERVGVSGNTEVLIQGVGAARGTSAWCPVVPGHFLSKGNAPNWTTAHYCVTDYYGGTTPCAQFICYQPKPLF